MKLKNIPLLLRPLIACGAIAAISSIVTATPASAHGATTVQVDGDYGPYHIVVVTGPSADARQVLITVILTLSATASNDAEAQAVPGATVQAVLTMHSARVVYSIPAEARLAQSGYYERTLGVPTEGDWQVTLEVSGDRGQASVTFPLSLRSAPLWVQLSEWVFVAALVVFAVLYLRGSKLPEARNK